MSPIYRLDLPTKGHPSSKQWLPFTNGLFRNFCINKNFIYSVGINYMVLSHPINIYELPSIKNNPIPCAVNFNQNIPDKSKICPEFLPICTGYEANKKWGICGPNIPNNIQETMVEGFNNLSNQEIKIINQIQN